jgi:hypothetical protein
MEMKDAKAKLSRRNFLLAVGAGGAATAAAIAAKTVPQQPAPELQDKKAGKGYQDTAHVRHYYRTTQV